MPSRRERKNIAEVQITPIKPRDGLIGFASLILGGKLYLSSIGIHTKLDGSGIRITYPTKKVGNQNFGIYYPINKSLGKEIEEAITNKAKEVFDI